MTLVPHVSTAPSASTSQTTAGANGQTSTGSISQLEDPKVFLKLLVAELQNQDPTNPTDPASILQQTSQLAQMQAVNQMTTAMAAEQNATATNEATGMIGRTITATVSGSPLTGTVSSVAIDSSGNPSVLVGTTTVPLSAITSIQ